MKKGTIRVNDEILYRVSKCEARKLVKKGYTIYAKPHKMNPYNIFCDLVVINNEILVNYNQTFDSYLRHYEIYNCNYECGYYCDFWFDLQSDNEF